MKLVLDRQMIWTSENKTDSNHSIDILCNTIYFRPEQGKIELKQKEAIRSR
jgi:hypothetical protein